MDFGRFDNAARLERPGNRYAESQHAARVRDGAVAAEREADARAKRLDCRAIPFGVYKPPPKLRAHVGMATGDNGHGRRNTCRLRRFDGRFDAIIIDIGPGEGRGMEIGISRALRQRSARFAERGADIDVAALGAVQFSGTLDQFFELIGAEHLRVAKRAGRRIGPRQFDEPIERTVEAAAEHQFDMAEHRGAIGLDFWRVRRHSRSRALKGSGTSEGAALPVIRERRRIRSRSRRPAAAQASR